MIFLLYVINIRVGAVMKMIIRVDDFGFSEAVNYGVMKAYSNGLVKNIGLMSNMPYASHAFQLIQDKKDVLLGLHVNLILGKPCADPRFINTLLDEQGNFISSKIRREQILDHEDRFDYHQTLCEVKAQIERFRSICGKLPDYIDAHAVCTLNSEKAITDAANAYQIKIQGHKKSDLWDVIQKDYTNEDFYQKHLPFVDFFKTHLHYSNKINLVVFHAGYVDHDVISQSSLTLNRAMDAALLCDEEVKRYLNENATLLTFKEAGDRDGR